MAAETVRLATADAAFVYATDAAGLHLEATALDTSLFPEALYPLAMLGPRNATRDSLWAFLHSPVARELAAAKGFR
jgi:ABC-type molybdate transport system substrate-binding protein